MNVADYANEFVRRAQAGEKPRARIQKQYAEAFLGEMVRLGVGVARACLDEITDPELRRIVETLFFSTVAGAAAGATIGAFVAGPPGAKVGALVGAGAGFAAGALALTITLQQDAGPDGPELVVAVAS